MPEGAGYAPKAYEPSLFNLSTTPSGPQAGGTALAPYNDFEFDSVSFRGALPFQVFCRGRVGQTLRLQATKKLDSGAVRV